MKNIRKIIFIFSLMMLPVTCMARARYLTVTAVNKLKFGRVNQTITLNENQLSGLGKVDLNNLHVKDAAGRELLCQAVDSDGDYHPDEIIFQADFAPHQTRHFVVYIGKRHLYNAKQFKVYGRYVRERHGDFAWENDRIADRTYGKALQNWKLEPLTSSALDVLCKKGNKLVLNNWYMTGHMHTDTGEGADLYTAGNSRGVGGNGLWSGGKLWTSKNYVQSRVFSKGPIRILFQLKYTDFNVDENNVKETSHISLDAGQNLNHFVCHFTPQKSGKLVAGIGIQKSDLTESEVRKGIKPGQRPVPVERSPGAFIHKDVNAKYGWITTQQPLSEGMLNCAIIVNPNDFVKVSADNKNELVLARVPKDNTISYWAGYTWSKSGQFKNYDEWKSYVSHFAQELRSPIQLMVTSK
ncbi:MAG TPA: DUF4861 family protein [Balneolales bacterium]|nr:DUF4861 family protein [Balneolales bacterium]